MSATKDTIKMTYFPAEGRGIADFGWLKARYSFSFARYYDKDKMNFGLLRVLNDDIVMPGEGFGKHPHDNMEIVTIPLQGALQHEDSKGHKGIIRKGEVQIMSAGKGIYHSEFNASENDTLNLLQIWVFPKEEDIEPRYDQKRYSEDEIKNRFRAVVSPDQQDSAALWINQDSWFSLGHFDKETEQEYNIHKPGNGIYVFIIKGDANVEGKELKEKDALGIQDINRVKIIAKRNSEILLIEVPMK